MKTRVRTICDKTCKMDKRLLVIAVLLTVLASCSSNDDDPKLRFFYGSIDKYTELPISEAENIFQHSWYNASRKTVIFCHGFKGHPEGKAVRTVIETYLEQDQSNVALLNWEKLAAQIQPSISGSYVNWAAPNVKKVAIRFAETLYKINSAGIDLNRVNLIGFSLGAHVFGIAGNNLAQKGIKVAQITGLDPAGTGFEGRAPQNRLNPNSANLVVVIHCDPSKYGYKQAIGNVDFWPNYRNGEVRQPGCEKRSQIMFSPEDLCNHNRCWELLTDALKYPGTILGSYAKNFRTWKRYSQEERMATVLDIATLPETIVPGNYYFITNSKSPYGLGKNGL